jgi:hypothetical protein
MNDTQLYLALGVPSFVVLAGIFVNVGYFVALNARITSMETRTDGRIDRFDERLNARFDRLESSIVSKLDLLTGKVLGIDNRLTRVEEQLKHR